MPKPGNRAANLLVMRFVTAKLKAATQRFAKPDQKNGSQQDCEKRDDRRGELTAGDEADDKGSEAKSLMHVQGKHGYREARDQKHDQNHHHQWQNGHRDIGWFRTTC